MFCIHSTSLHENLPFIVFIGLCKRVLHVSVTCWWFCGFCTLPILLIPREFMSSTVLPGGISPLVCVELHGCRMMCCFLFIISLFCSLPHIMFLRHLILPLVATHDSSFFICLWLDGVSCPCQPQATIKTNGSLK